MSGVLFLLPAEVVGVAAVVADLQPHLANLDVPVSSRATPEDVKVGVPPVVEVGP